MSYGDDWEVTSLADAKAAIGGMLHRLGRKPVIHYGATSWCAGRMMIWTLDDERRGGQPGWCSIKVHQHNPETGVIVTPNTVYLPEVYRG